MLAPCVGWILDKVILQRKKIAHIKTGRDIFISRDIKNSLF